LNLIAGLQVHSERMGANIELSNGLIFAENVSTELAKSLGKSAAHSVITRASKTVRQTGQHLRKVLAEDSASVDLVRPGARNSSAQEPKFL
jgi:3-carboxy-cis,cis-muconate cycloisomerase